MLLCVWDGMRPDFIDAENTPNLHALVQSGTFFANHHAFYVSTTEVNGTLLATGVFPRRSGIMSNREYRPAINLTETVATENWATMRVGDALTDGKYLGTRTVAELAQQAGMTTVVAGTKSVALLHDRSPDRTGKSPTLFAGKTYPEEFLKTIVAVQGRFPDAPKSVIADLSDARPNTAQNAWTTQALIDFLWRENLPRYTVLWLGDPDFSQHLTSPGSPTALAAIHDSDTNLGLVLAALEKRGAREKTDIFVVSDHGFSTIAHIVDVAAYLKKGGLPAVREFKTTPRPGEVLVSNVGGHNGIFVIGKNRAVIQRIVDLLQVGNFAGPIFTREGLAGTFTLANGRFDTPDAPDVLFGFRWSPGANKYGTPGLIFGEGKRPGLGTHGTLSPFEVRNTLVAAGPDLRPGFRNELPTGNIDVAPTLLAILGLEQPGGCDGRVLVEALQGVEFNPPAPQSRRIEAKRPLAAGTWMQYLQVTKFGDKLYFDEGNAGIVK